MARHWVILNPNGTYYCGPSGIGPCFGVDLEEAARYGTKRDAESLLLTHLAFIGCQVLRADRAPATDSAPTIVQKRALDVTPYYHGIWCSIADGAPFVNTIVHRSWSEDGSRIFFGLDSHNGLSAEPGELIDVVEITPSAPADMVERWMKTDAKRMSRQPVLATCPHCKGTGKTWQRPEENPFKLC